jgi:Secretion system C-terminal sorting domain
MKRILIIFFTALAVMFLYETALSFKDGIGGHTRKNIGTIGDGCICHMADSTSGVVVRITGPGVVVGNSVNTYRITMRGGPAITGGFDFNVKYGNTDTVQGEGTTVIIEDPNSLDISHRNPKPFTSDSVSWLVKYKAPDTNIAIFDTLYATGNSTNNNLFPDDGDKWDFSPNFIVLVTPSIGIKKISTIAEQFALLQNYPNPFNPVTRIRFSIPQGTRGSSVNLVIYDSQGKQTAVLVNEQLSSGTYEYDWNALDFASGIYYYRLTTGSYSQVRKMILVK